MSWLSEPTPYADTSNWYGITPPVSEALPEEADLTRTRSLTEALKSFGVFEDDLELQRREKVLKQLESLYKEWLREFCIEMNVPESVTEKVGGKICPFGSYHLGVHSKGADIDVLCIGPRFLTRKDFFTSFLNKLKAQEEVKDIRAIEEAFVPVIKMTFDGIEIDLVFARSARMIRIDKLDLLNNDVLRGMDEVCVRSLNGYRVTEQILRAVPNASNFRLALRAIKLWAKRRNIYSHMLGFLGGVSWAILVARICQLYPNATASTLVIKFFKGYTLRDTWAIPIELRDPVVCDLGLHVWDPRVNPRDRCLMPIITPAYPEQNTSVNVSRSTLAIIREEVQRGHAICEEILREKADWSKLFHAPIFFDKYKHYIVLEASSASETHRVEWVGLVESKIRLLVGMLEGNRNISLAHVHLQSFPGSRKDNAEGEMSTQWLIGLIFNMDGYKTISVDLSPALQSFSNTIYTLAESFKIFEKGMAISATYVRREHLSRAMPDAEHIGVFLSKQKPTVSRQISAAAPQHHTPLVSTGRPASKRKGCSHSEMPAKKVKADNESVSVASGSSVPASAHIKPASLSSTPQATKRPRSPHSETSCKKFRFDEEPAKGTSSESSAGVSVSQGPSQSASSASIKRPRHPEPETPSKKVKMDQSLPAVEPELPDLPPAPTKPAVVMKHGIKLQLLSRRN